MRLHRGKLRQGSRPLQEGIQEELQQEGREPRVTRRGHHALRERGWQVDVHGKDQMPNSAFRAWIAQWPKQESKLGRMLGTYAHTFRALNILE